MRPWSTSGRLLPGLTAQKLLTQGPAVQLLLKTMNAETAEHVGIQKLKRLVMENIKEFVAAGPLENDIRKPRCSPEVAKPLGTRLWTQQILDQVISHEATRRRSKRACTWSRPKASSFKQQAQRDSSFKRQASSPKHKGSSFKPQASSSWTMDPGKSFKHL